MRAWQRLPGGRFVLMNDKAPHRIAYVQRDKLGWEWVVRDVAGVRISVGLSATASAARATAANRIAVEGMTDQAIERLQQERRDAGFSQDEWI